MTGKTKWRIIYAPNAPMRALHRQLITFLRSLGVDLSSATAFLPGSSPLGNIKRHTDHGGKYYLVIDLRGAYEQVNISELAFLLWKELWDNGKMEDCEDIQSFLELYCRSREMGLATGAPAAPDLFNIYAGFKLDPILRSACVSRGITYTRYGDDLVFSSCGPMGVYKRGVLFRRVREAGFEINYLKCKYFDLALGPALVTGYRIYEDGRVAVPSDYIKALRVLLYEAKQGKGSFEVLAGKMSPLVALSRSVFWEGLTMNERRILGDFRRYLRGEHRKKKKEEYGD